MNGPILTAAYRQLTFHKKEEKAGFPYYLSAQDRWPWGSESRQFLSEKKNLQISSKDF